MKQPCKGLEKPNICRSHLYCHLACKFTEVAFSHVTSIPEGGEAAVCCSFCLFLSRDTHL